jgi:hypothetical protein
MKRGQKMIFCLIPLAVVLMGCASGGGGNNAGMAQAAKLAKDLNAIKAGSAEVSGGTVTLSGWVGLKKALTVPEGVTLDLTAEGAALELQDGAVLTVNGTVKTSGHGDHGKGWVEGGLRVGDGAAVINGSGTINLKGKGRILNIGSDKGKRQLTLDGVTLAGLPDNDHSLVGICVNGAIILKSGAIMGNTYTSDEWAGGGGVEVHKGTFTMEGGEISGNTAQGNDGSRGGGVRIGEESVFTMSGGTISGNTAKGGEWVSGGGVVVTNATFIMTNGTIAGNRSAGKEWKNSNSGGVRVQGAAVFTMSGGEITGNTTSEGGGGVLVDNDSTFTMEGGTIYGKAESLPAGTDASLANSAGIGASLSAVYSTAKWGTGGTYTKGGASQSGGSYIVNPSPNHVGTDDTLIAAP